MPKHELSIIERLKYIFTGKDPMIVGLDNVLAKIDELAAASSEATLKIGQVLIDNDNSLFMAEFVNALTTTTNYMTYGKNRDGIITISSDNLRFSIGLPTKVNGLTTEEVIARTSDEYKDIAKCIFTHDVEKDNNPFLCKVTVDGVDLKVRVRKHAFYDGKGRYIGVCVIVDDVSDRLESLRIIRDITKSPRIIRELEILETKILLK